MRSFPYVSGEKNATICPMAGIDSRGIKMPDINMRGNLTRFSIDTISPGLSVGYTAKRVPIVAKQNEVSIIPSTRGIALTRGGLKMSNPAISTIKAMPML